MRCGIKKTWRKNIIFVFAIIIVAFMSIQEWKGRLDTREFAMSELAVSGENESECDDNSLQIEIKDKNGVMIDSPVMRFSEGSYRFALSYETSDSGNYAEIVSDTTMADDGTVGVVYAKSELDPSENRITFDVDFEQEITNVQIRVICTSGVITLTEMVWRNYQKYSDALWGGAALIGIILCTWMYLAASEKWKSRYSGKIHVIIFCLSFAFLCTLPYMNDFLINGHDLKFHLARIEGVADALKQGQFPVHINPTQANGYGNASATMYPQFFIYFPAVLRLTNLSLLNTYKVLIFLINLITALCAWIGFKNVWKSRKAGYLGCAIYMMGLYRLDDLYIRAAIGEALALAFLPIVFWGMYEILFADKKKWPVAAIGFSFVVQSHILSLELYGVLTIIVFVIWLLFADDKEKKKRVLAAVKAGTITIVWNLWFFVPFFDYFRSGFAIMDDTSVFLPDRTVYLSQVFTFFEHQSGQGSLARGTTRGEMPLTLGLLPLICVFLGVYVYHCCKDKISQNQELQRYEKIGNYVLIAYAFLLCFSLWIIPWDVVETESFLYQSVSKVQFLWRFLGIIYFGFCCVSYLME